MRKIEDIQVGDVVWSRPEAGEHDETPVARRVTRTVVTHPEVLVHVRYRTADGFEETLSGTANHPFYSVDRGDFVHAVDLEPGELLSLPSSECAEVVDVSVEVAEDGEPFTTYNFTVEETHTYFVGNRGVWVHNVDSRACFQAAKELAEQLRETPGMTDEAQELFLKNALKKKGVNVDKLDDHLLDSWKQYEKLTNTPNGIDLKYWNESKQVNGRRVFQRDDFFDASTRSAWQDPVTKQWKRGTNKERMADGLAPVGKDGLPVALHHLTQTEPGSLAEISTTLHRKVPHKLLEPKQSFRNNPNRVKEFNSYRAEYWKRRANDF